ncbi:MAG: hypothetical protein BAJATHORv1_20036 [Candidatus Thorarchaeota archaeon]|nr:MAG: hypothetical protein BAJATHORv1_20036 [Candidatus Thorarchaeota archaeon]
MNADEKELEQIGTELEMRFSEVGECTTFTAPEEIIKVVKDKVGDDATRIIESWDRLPDMVGLAQIQKPLSSASKRLVLVEVIDALPQLQDIYRMKRYSETLTPEYSFLVIKKDFDKQIREFLEDHPHMLMFLTKESRLMSGTKPITVLHLNDMGSLERDEELSSADPFDPKHMWS